MLERNLGNVMTKNPCSNNLLLAAPNLLRPKEHLRKHRDLNVSENGIVRPICLRLLVKIDINWV